MSVSRNDPCPCGSGLRFKKCCGKLSEEAISSPPSNASPAPAEFEPIAALFHAGRYAEMESQARLLLERHPASGMAWKLLGVALGVQGKDALLALRKAAELLPDDVDVHNNLGNALQDLGQHDDAVASYRRALGIKPDFASAQYNLGICLEALGQLDAATTSYRRALEIKPDYAEAHSNLGNALKDLGQLDSAEISYRQALEINPVFAEAHSNLLLVLNYTVSHATSYYLEEARRYGQMVTKKVRMGGRFSSWRCVAEPDRLRVGVVSGDLRNHPVGYFLENLLNRLDSTRIEIVAYLTSDDEDDLTARIKPRFTAWKSLFGLSDEAAAHLIHSDGVHVLLDLSGHTAKNRLPMFAWKPAPVQASWLGYFATTGVAEMDYFLTDEVSVLEAQREYFTETVLYLPDTRFCFTPPQVDLPVANLPALENGFITFACFQNLAKVGDEVLVTWGEILAALPGARLRWQCKQFGDPTVVAQCVQRLQQYGINPDRVRLLGMVSRAAYLAAHAEVDVVLDTFPFTGGTTTCEALWMGVPTLSLAGATLVARQGASLLTAVGLRDWVVTSKADYVEKAISLTSDLSKLMSLRAGLRAQVLASPICDAPSFARNFEEAMWVMWQRNPA